LLKEKSKLFKKPDIGMIGEKLLFQQEQRRKRRSIGIILKLMFHGLTLEVKQKMNYRYICLKV